MVVIPLAPKVRAEVLAVPIWTRPLVEVPVPPWMTTFPPVEVVPVLLLPFKTRLEPVPELVVESPGWMVMTLEVPAEAVVISLVWAPARVTTPAEEILKFEEVRVKALAPRVQVEAPAPVRFKAPAEVTAKVPEVAVEMVKFPEVLVQEEVPPEARVMAPVELPMPTVLPPVAAKVTLPETFNPPVPWICPEPAFRPTEVMAPALETLKFGALM